MSDAKYCKDCKNINCPEGRVNCKYPDAIACALYRDTPPTVFQRITQSIEMLAEFLVFHNRIYKGRTKYYSSVVGGEFDSREAAKAATIEKLKEVLK